MSNPLWSETKTKTKTKTKINMDVAHAKGRKVGTSSNKQIRIISLFSFY